MIDLKGFEKYLREEELAENTIDSYIRGSEDLRQNFTREFQSRIL